MRSRIHLKGNFRPVWIAVLAGFNHPFGGSNRWSLNEDDDLFFGGGVEEIGPLADFII
jgi:hypothetical protein